MASDSDNDAGASVTSDSGSHGPPCRIAAVAVAQQRMFIAFISTLSSSNVHAFPVLFDFAQISPKDRQGVHSSYTMVHFVSQLVTLIKLAFSVFLLVQNTTVTFRVITKSSWATRTWSPLGLTHILLLSQMMRVMMRMMTMSQECVGPSTSHVLIMTSKLIWSLSHLMLMCVCLC